MWTKQEIEEQNNFDYAALFNSEVEEVVMAEVEARIIYPNVKITPTSYDMRHHLARLAMMMAEERGQELSYKQALKQ
jgi:hypothetical protein